MLYTEFVQGTGCKDNEHNYKVYKDLEIMYMNSDMSKSDIYEYGKKLVNNSKSEEQLKLEAEINEEIKSLRQQIKYYKSMADYYKEMAKYDKSIGDKSSMYANKSSEEWNRVEAKKCRNRIEALKWVLA